MTEAPASPTGPLVVTATMGAADFAWADAERRRHYPPDRNRVPAHITLFHHLPPARRSELTELLRQLAREGAPRARLNGLVNLGTGVAYTLDSPALLDMRAHIAERFQHDLIGQDLAYPRLHITIQNKVAPSAARQLHARLAADFRPRSFAIAGFSLWSHSDGRLHQLAAIAFR